MKNRRRNNIIIGTLCAVLVLMGVGYAILSTTLNIGATANITGDFDIHFTNIQRSSSTISDSTILSTIDAGTGITANTSSRAGTFTAILQKPTDYVIYTVSVANTGSIDGYLTFSFEDTNSNFDYYKDFYSVEFIRDDVNPAISTDILQPNATFTDNEVLVKTSGTRTYKIKVTFKESATSFPDPTHEINNQAVGNFECELNLTYSQQAPGGNSGGNNEQQETQYTFRAYKITTAIPSYWYYILIDDGNGNNYVSLYAEDLNGNDVTQTQMTISSGTVLPVDFVNYTGDNKTFYLYSTDADALAEDTSKAIDTILISPSTAHSLLPQGSESANNYVTDNYMIFGITSYHKYINAESLYSYDSTFDVTKIDFNFPTN